MTSNGSSRDPVLILYGPTASGKSDLAATLAERLDGVVINADSLQLYAELEILTARPDARLLSRAPHRLYGVLSAAHAGSAAWWREAAIAEIVAARQSGKRPIVTGGTGLYLKALMEGLSPLPPADLALRARATALYAEMGGETFRAQLLARDPVVAARLAPSDRQRLIRAWEVVEATGVPLSAWQAMPRDPGHDLSFCLVGLVPPRTALYSGIDQRFLEMLYRGALAEAERFAALGLSPALPANKALGLSQLRRCLAGEIDLPEAVRLAQQATRNYAKRQLTWFRHQLSETLPVEGQNSGHVQISDVSAVTLAEIMAIARPSR